MNSERRPGGLTALAVVNFIFAGISLLGAVGFIPLMLMNAEMTEGMSEQQQAALEAMMQLGDSWFVVFIASSLVTVILLVASGIGYLKLRQFLGRTIGNVYAVYGIIVTAATGILIPAELGGGFGLGTLLGFVYPVLTLILLNSTFKEDFIK